ncbi:MAG: outer membrane lipoprotein carrier protein LolA [Alphaproteobacteria bacterium]|nr:outer membrane lipoprotein carrier protein LolA [Alphaproteobacteria bacterium]
MRSFISALLAASLSLLAATAAPAQTGVPEVERYINSIRTFQARFIQTSPNGSIVQGDLYVRRPGRMRFAYDAPSQLKVVADGTQVTMWDPQTKDFGQWPLGWTAASFLVKEPFLLSGDITVESMQRANNELQLTLVQTRKPQEGKVIVRLSENPMQLRGWTIVDNRGNRVAVSLAEFKSGQPLADSLFKFDGVDPSLLRQRN